MWGFAFLLSTAVAIGIVNSQQKPQFDDFAPWPSLLVGCLSMLTYGFASQYFAANFGNRAKSFLILFIFFAWIVPIVIGMLARAAQIHEGDYFLVVSQSSAFLPPVTRNFSRAGSDCREDRQHCSGGHFFSVLFFFLLIGEERPLRDEIREEHDRRHANQGT